YRAYHALLTRDREDPSKWVPLRNSRGEATNAILGFANTVLKIRREEKPDYWALAWDGPGKTFRHERFAEYKATRKPMPDDLLSQVRPVEEMAKALGLPVIQIPGMEADDVMATLARSAEKDGLDVVLITGDKDLVQLVSDRVKVLAPLRRGEEYAWIDRAAVIEKWGVPPEHVVDVLALLGDTIDNVPGVPGIGDKTADELLRAYGSLEGIYEHLAEIKKPSIRARLEANREQAFLSRELVTVKTDLDLECTWEDLRVQPIRPDAFRDLVLRYELKALERRLPEIAREEQSRPAASPPAPEPRAEASAPMQSQASLDLWLDPVQATATATAPEELEAEVRAVLEDARAGLAIHPLFEGEHPRTARVVGLGVATPKGASYIPIGHEGASNVGIDRLRDWLGLALADPQVPKIGIDLKGCAHLLEGLGLELALHEGAPDVDLRVLSFLCDPERDHSLEAMARDFLGASLPRLGEAPGGRRIKPSALPLEAGAMAARITATLIPLAQALRAQLEARDQWGLYETLERPLTPVLLDMERAGVRLDASALRAMSRAAAEEIDRLRVELVAMAGEPINLDSGPQVAKVMFETLGLKAKGRTPGGALSTRQDVLEDLAGVHAFPARLLEYRALSKLRSTYFDALPAEVDPRDGRVHTVFDQTGAATGRISSSHPNLQNIPMRTERGRRIRQAFVAAPGAVLIGADYSQIELRVMAHLSGDPGLVAAFESGDDVHDRTARSIFKVQGPLDPGLRARAKIVNFGIMYGMGARSLAQQMGIPLAEAQAFIAEYFRVFGGVRAFLDRTMADARQQGWVATLLGRRRYLPGLDSAHGGERSATERAAINTPIQGSAADLMKLAMIRVAAALKAHIPSARLLLQVHDELLLECPMQDADLVSERVREEMEGCFPLRVPLVVTVGRGSTWFDVH
ncbi:MAG TPA: DNA polymerase I, partial [Candidatus Eisenbacteria bacterium]|nr:DNA polymerase I [Candidatus Eisenbacteria bacterium]